MRGPLVDRAAPGVGQDRRARGPGRPSARRGAVPGPRHRHGPRASRQASSGSALPLAAIGSTGSASTASRTREYVSRPSRISPGGAACSSRRRGVDGVAGDEGGPGLGVARHDLARVHPGPEADGDPALRLELAVHGAQGVADLPGGPDRPQGVVLVDRGDPEHRHHRIADELLDRPPVALDDRAHRGEVAGHQGPQRLGVQLLAQGRRPGHVGEQDRHDLAHLARGRGRLGLRAPHSGQNFAPAATSAPQSGQVRAMAAVSGLRRCGAGRDRNAAGAPGLRHGRSVSARNPGGRSVAK